MGPKCEWPYKEQLLLFVNDCFIITTCNVLKYLLKSGLIFLKIYSVRSTPTYLGFTHATENSFYFRKPTYLLHLGIPSTVISLHQFEYCNIQVNLYLFTMSKGPLLPRDITSCTFNFLTCFENVKILLNLVQMVRSNIDTMSK